MEETEPMWFTPQDVAAMAAEYEAKYGPAKYNFLTPATLEAAANAFPNAAKIVGVAVLIDGVARSVAQAQDAASMALGDAVTTSDDDRPCPPCCPECPG